MIFLATDSFSALPYESLDPKSAVVHEQSKTAQAETLSIGTKHASCQQKK